jgi:hypothetical protein
MTGHISNINQPRMPTASPGVFNRRCYPDPGSIQDLDQSWTCKRFTYGKARSLLTRMAGIANAWASPVHYMKHGLEPLLTGSQGALNALELTRKYDAGFLLASTWEYTATRWCSSSRVLFGGNVNPVGPLSVYDEAKRFADAFTMAYHRYNRPNTHIVRIFNTYGPRLQPDDGRVISNFMMQALRGEELTVYGNGSQTRSFCYVSFRCDPPSRAPECPPAPQTRIISLSPGPIT